MKNWAIRIRTRFLCRSLAPDSRRAYFYGIFAMNVGIILWYFLRVARNITTKHIDNEHARLYGFYVVPAIAMFFELVGFLKAGYTDPGIVPRSNQFLEYAPEKFIIVNGEECPIKYCKTCRIYRPPRTVHCGICNNCVSGIFPLII